MNGEAARHRALTPGRLRAFHDLFEGDPVATHSYPDERCPIDVLVFALETDDGTVFAAATNGMSDQRMTDPDDPETWTRRELIQYFRDCTPDHARRLRDMAWLPHFDGFLLDSHHSVGWPHPAVEGTPWNNAYFLEPIIIPHREFTFEVEGDVASLLWHIPISDAERAYKRERGSDALIDRMSEVGLPWVFDEAARPPLVD